MFRYQGDGWRVAESIRTFGNQIMGLRGNIISYPTDGTLGDVDHSNRVSDHNPDESNIVRALDFHESSDGFVDQVAERLRTAKDPRLKYFIHDTRMFSSYSTSTRQAWAWGPYTGVNGHKNHGHLSVVAGALADTSKEWAIGAAPQPIPEDEMYTKGYNEADWKRLWDAGVVVGTSWEAFKKYWVTDAAKRTDEEHLQASGNIVLKMGDMLKAGATGLTAAQVVALVHTELKQATITPH